MREGRACLHAHDRPCMTCILLCCACTFTVKEAVDAKGSEQKAGDRSRPGQEADVACRRSPCNGGAHPRHQKCSNRLRLLTQDVENRLHAWEKSMGYLATFTGTGQAGVERAQADNARLMNNHEMACAWMRYTHAPCMLMQRVMHCCMYRIQSALYLRNQRRAKTHSSPVHLDVQSARHCSLLQVRWHTASAQCDGKHHKLSPQLAYSCYCAGVQHMGVTLFRLEAPSSSKRVNTMPGERVWMLTGRPCCTASADRLPMRCAMPTATKSIRTLACEQRRAYRLAAMLGHAQT